MKFKIIALFVLCLCAYFIFSIGDEASDTVTKIGKADKTVDLSGKKAELVDGTTLLSQQKVKMAQEKSLAALTQETAMENISNLLDSAAGGTEGNITAERALIEYLKITDDQKVYQYIYERLINATLASVEGDKLMEYGLSILASVESKAATELLLRVVNHKDWENSDAIYLVKKSIAYLNQNGVANAQMQQAFTQSKDNSPFLNEIARSLVKKPNPEQVDFLFSYVQEEDNSKAVAAINALTSIKLESMVPTVSQYLVSSSSEQVEAALNSLANLGQYEAASALISWSATQPAEQKASVTQLFDTAVSRSPSTLRAIKKEAVDKSFESSEIKSHILSYLAVNPVKKG